jgi:hypothetical protein
MLRNVLIVFYFFSFHSVSSQLLGTLTSGYANGNGGEYTLGQLVVGDFENESIIVSHNAYNLFFEDVLGVESVIDITIFPNPFTNQVSVSAKSGIIESIKLIDTSSKQLFEMTFNSKNASLDLSGLPEQLYYLSIKLTNHEIGVFKILKK